jgi:hypothetical protein
VRHQRRHPAHEIGDIVTRFRGGPSGGQARHSPPQRL